MPFGTIQVIYTEKPRPAKAENRQPAPTPESASTPAPAPAPAPVYGAGLQRMEFLVAAPSRVEAVDFVCGAYFNMVHMTGGSRVSAYTRDFQTITRLTERKQDLETAIMRPPGTEVYLRPQDAEGLEDILVTISQSGNQDLALDLHFRCGTPGAGGGADAVFALLRPGDPRNAEVIAGVSSAQRVFYVVSGFEEQAVFMDNATASALKADLRARLTEGLGSPIDDGGFLACSQVYGGLLFDRREDGALVCRTNARCREYAPVGCHIPVFTAVTEIARRRIEADENIPARALCDMIANCFREREPASSSWCSPNKGVIQG